MGSVLQTMSRTAVLAVALALFGCTDGPGSQPQSGKVSAGHPYLALEFVRQFQLRRDAGEAVVPEGAVWAIDGHDVTEGRVTTADVLIDGRTSIGGFELEGQYWLTFQKAQSQTVWVYEKTKVGLGDTRPTLTVKEFRDVTGR